MALGGSRAIRRFAPSCASSLPLPLSPTGSGAWTYRRGPGDHRTRGVLWGRRQRCPPCAAFGHHLATPNRLAAVRYNHQCKIIAVRFALSKSNAAVSLAKKSFFFSILRFHQIFSSRDLAFRASGGSRAIRRFAPPRASSLPLPLSPTGSGAWTCWRGPGDHSTRRRDTGNTAKVFRLAPTYGHPLLTLTDRLP